MGSSRDLTKIPNKIKRREQNLKTKREKESSKRDERLRRRRTEDKDPSLRSARRAANLPATIDSKRTWDVAQQGSEYTLGSAVDLNSIKRRRVDEDVEDKEHDSDVDSMLEDDDDGDDDEVDEIQDEKASPENVKTTAEQQDSHTEKPSVDTPNDADVDADAEPAPDSLQSRFPSLFAPLTHDPKILITTSINSKLHSQAELLTALFPNSNYIRRTAGFYGHKYSIKEIAAFASNREYTTLIILNEDLKKPTGLDVVHLPNGPMFHFSISNWTDGKRLPGHGNPTHHNPELILNGFRTPLGLLTAHLFRTMFPPQPEHQGRQVVTLHNQRDYIFLRRHRYVFRDKRATEKSIQGADGKPVEGVEEIKAGLQELGPRFTLKLRRVDNGVQKATGQEWKWAPKQEKIRTRFQL